MMNRISKSLTTLFGVTLLLASTATAGDRFAAPADNGTVTATLPVDSPMTSDNQSGTTPPDTILGSPGGVPFQGFLTDAAGNPLGVPTPVDVTVDFRFYDAVSGGTLLHSEAHMVSVSDGVFHASLEPPSNLFHGLPRFLGLAVDGGAELSPRTEVLSTPFALVSRTLSGDGQNVSAQLMLGTGITEIVTRATTDLVLRRFYLNNPTGTDWTGKSGRVIIAANGQATGGSGTITVWRNSSAVATIPVQAGGTRPWTCAVDLPGLANFTNIDVTARADNAANPLLVRSITFETDTDTNTIGDSDWTVVGNNMNSTVSGNVGVGIAAAATNAKLDVDGGSGRGLEIMNTGATDRFALYARNTNASGTTAVFHSPAYAGGGYPATATAVVGDAAGTDNGGSFSADNGDAVWARVDGTGSAIRGWDYGGLGLAGEFVGDVEVGGDLTATGTVDATTLTASASATVTGPVYVAGNVQAYGGDFYTSATDGVINCGGGFMNEFANVIADVPPTIAVANGDEDLYIADDLEVGSQGYKPGGGSWATLSDARLKKDVRDFEDGLDAVLRINPIWYRYEDGTPFADGREYVGVVAQDMLEVAPYTVEEKAIGQVVREDERGNEIIVEPGEKFLTYDSSALVYMLVNAVREQQAMIEQQRGRIEELERRVGAR